MKKEQKYIIGGISMLGIITGVVLGVRYYKKRKARKKYLNAVDQRIFPKVQTRTSLKSNSKVTGSFPLTRWTGGAIVEKVQQLQRALMKIPSVASLIMNSGGDDGKLGSCLLYTSDAADD